MSSGGPRIGSAAARDVSRLVPQEHSEAGTRSCPGSEPNVAILLSTWNGARFLPAQLDSLLAQQHRRWTLIWRDDGSSDATIAIMEAFARGAGAGRVIDRRDGRGRLGIAASFLHLLRGAPADRVIAFADQDDVWLPEKLSRGIAALAAVPAGTPALYCARQLLVDESLQPIRLSATPRHHGFPAALTQNIATGCTVMLNPRGAEQVGRSKPPAATLHDWWCYIIIAAAGGAVIADHTPTLLYRQHAANAVGVPLSPLRRSIAALRRGPGVFMGVFASHVAALQAEPELLTPEARAAVATIGDALGAGPLRRLRTLRRSGLVRQGWAETQLFRLWFILGPSRYARAKPADAAAGAAWQSAGGAASLQRAAPATAAAVTSEPRQPIPGRAAPDSRALSTSTLSGGFARSEAGVRASLPGMPLP